MTIFSEMFTVFKFVVNYESDFYTQFVLQMNFSKEDF